MNFLVVGAGLSGAVIARELANDNHNVNVIDKRSHIAGNCFTEKDEETGIMQHSYGPHIFHTNNKEIWEYITNHGEFKPYINRVKSIYKNQVYSLPINLHTINQFYKKSLSPAEAMKFINEIANKKIKTPKNFEEKALTLIGEDLYKAFFYGYTKKQWGIEPTELPASILNRLPVRFNYDDNYFSHRYQGIPTNGYTEIIKSILNHKNIEIQLNTKFEKSLLNNYDYVVWTGKIDEWFDYCEGNLSYRTLDFEKHVSDGDFQGNAVINYSDESIRYTRIAEHKHFTPWENHSKTIYFKEYSRECQESDTPYYPVRTERDNEILKKYLDKAEENRKVFFLGRLGTYKYLDMDMSIDEALILHKKIKSILSINS